MAPHGHAHRGIRVEAGVAVLTVSDSRDESTDRSGARARELLAAAGHRVVDHAILRDEPDAVRRQVESWLARADCDAVVVSGGTGISLRDRTYEALAGLLDKRLDGFGELFRALSFEQVGDEKTRVRVTLTGVDWDAEKYPVTIRTLQEEMHRQLFLKEGDKLGGEVQVQ